MVHLFWFILERRALAFDLGNISAKVYEDCTTICKDIADNRNLNKGLMLHSDIKPDNVLVIANLDSIEGRLIDYSCAAKRDILQGQMPCQQSCLCAAELYGKSLMPKQKSMFIALG